MCAICQLLDKSFPNPRQLARAYLEVLDAGGSGEEHYEELEAKMFDAMQNQGLSVEEEKTYRNEFLGEYGRLVNLDF